jgi:DNA repair exonuclease SbcCD ATPase subunit
MDLEQMLKRLDWLEDERRKDKTTLNLLQDRMESIGADLPGMLQRLKELESELTHVTSTLARFDQVDAALAQLRVDLGRSVDTIEKTRGERERELEKTRRADVEILQKSIGDIKKGLEPIADLKKNVAARVEEEHRLGRLIEEMDSAMREEQRSEEEGKRSLRVLDEGRRQDAKKITDLQAEVAAFRKRMDEQRGKIDIANDSVRKVELRFSELQGAEAERRQSQMAFIERQSMLNVERERIWKDWQERYETFISQAQNVDGQLQSLEATNRAMKRSQDAFDDITQRFERRINEITEIQRLNEERFRQDWQAFKADDQKRWTNFTLVQEESQREGSRQFVKVNEHLVELDDRTQELNDLLTQVNEATVNRLQTLLSISREWLENFERSSGRSSPGA